MSSSAPTGPDGRPACAAILSVSALQATYTDICD